MPKVHPPTLKRRNGPHHRVHGWDIEPYTNFLKAAGDEPTHQSGLDRDAFVLSLWTESHQDQPIRFCLSPPAVARLARGLDQVLNEYLYDDQETE